jgi:hypothetical protein
MPARSHHNLIWSTSGYSNSSTHHRHQRNSQPNPQFVDVTIAIAQRILQGVTEGIDLAKSGVKVDNFLGFDKKS